MKNKTLPILLIISVSILFSVLSDASNLSGTGGSGGGSSSVVIGTLDGNTTSANGASVTGGSTIFMQSASGSVPGLVNNTTQTFSGEKTFTGRLVNSNSPATSESALLLSGATQAGGTATTNLPHALISPSGSSAVSSWSASGTGIGMNMSSGFAGRFIDFHVNGGASLFSVASTGALSTNSSASFAGNVTAPNVTLQATGAFSWVGRGIITSSGAGNVQLGNVDAASPVAQTLSAQSVVAGTSNTAGQNFIIAGSRGTGNQAGGSILFQVAAAGSSGTSQNSLSTAMTINSSGVVSLAQALVVNTGDVATTIPVFVGQVAGGSIFQIRGTGETVIGANGGTALHEINGATEATGANVLTTTNGPTAVTSANPTLYLKVKINGANYVIPAWPVP